MPTSLFSRYNGKTIHCITSLHSTLKKKKKKRGTLTALVNLIGNWTFCPFVSSPPGSFDPKSQDVSPPGRIKRFLVTLYILSLIIVKLRLTTFIKANYDDPAYSVKTQAPGSETSWGRTGETSINHLIRQNKSFTTVTNRTWERKNVKSGSKIPLS